MQVTVGLLATQVPTVEAEDASQSGQVVILQNLGPGAVFTDFTAAVTAADGFKVPVGSAYEFPRTRNNADLWMVADAAGTDVRVLLVD